VFNELVGRDVDVVDEAIVRDVRASMFPKHAPQGSPRGIFGKMNNLDKSIIINEFLHH